MCGARGGGEGHGGDLFLVAELEGIFLCRSEVNEIHDVMLAIVKKV